MRKILIAYADEKMKYSLNFLGKQAKSLHIFDQIILYTPKDMPSIIKQSPLFNYSRGAGYWVWKPYIIWHTLQKSDEGDFICYVDAGCTLKKGEDWNLYFSYLNSYDTLCFQYSNDVQGLSKFNTTSIANKCWTKKKTLLFFDSYFQSQNHRDFNQTLSGIIFCKNRNNNFIHEWLELTLKFPELIIDPIGDEINDQYPFFTGYHRHDQSLFTALAYKYSFLKSEAGILFENFESYHSLSTQIIRASRFRNINRRNTYIKFLILYYLCRIFHIKFRWNGFM